MMKSNNNQRKSLNIAVINIKLGSNWPYSFKGNTHVPPKDEMANCADPDKIANLGAF